MKRSRNIYMYTEVIGLFSRILFINRIIFTKKEKSSRYEKPFLKLFCSFETHS